MRTVTTALMTAGAGCDPTRAGHVVTGDLGDVTEGVFELVSGAETVVVRSRDLDGGDYRISTPREAPGPSGGDGK